MLSGAEMFEVIATDAEVPMLLKQISYQNRHGDLAEEASVPLYPILAPVVAEPLM